MATEIHAEVFDGTGTAVIWTIIRRASGRIEYVESIGTVVGVHTKEEAISAFQTERN